jgi:general secretion pathway protein F/type IV pilus assembly protein PilC
MPQFDYVARNFDGQNVAGSLAAGSKREVLAALAKKALFPLTVTPVDGATTKAASRQLPAWLRRVRADDLASCLTQLSDLLTNGVTLLDALHLLAEQTVNPLLAEVMADVRDRVADGSTLDQALALHPRIFSELTISMVRAGSEGAFLEEALQQISQFLRLQEELKSRVISALMYPLLLMTGGTVVTLVLVVFFVPKFQDLFDRIERRGNGLPWATHILLGTSDFLLGYGAFVVFPVGGVVYGAHRLLKRPQGKEWLDRIKLRLPVFGPIFHDTAVARFCRVLGTLLRNGVPILKSLQISSESTGNRQLGKAILQSAENVSSGETLSAPLAASGLIPLPVMAMIRVAEESNNLDQVLVNVANRLDRQIERRLDMMVRLVEPLMLVVIGVVVLFILSALLLPIFEMSSVVG